VLAARRTKPPRGWEFPGGKVEPGESDGVALERELLEELGVGVRALRLLGRVTDEHIELCLWQVELRSGLVFAGPDHDQLRWLELDELDTMDWLALDRELLRFVRPVLGAASAER
jgi:8-oxo-dGTP diphosphatase